MSFMLNLRLFESAGPAGGEAAIADTGGNAAGAVENALSPGEQAVEEPPTSEQLEAEFEQLLKGKFKDAYSKKVQAQMDARFKKAKATEAEFQKVQPVLDFLKLRYKDAQDPEAILRSLENDDYLLEQEALDKGVSTEQLREQKRAMLEAQSYKREADVANERIREYEEQQERVQRFQAWEAQAEQARQLFPGLDLIAEIQADPDFHRLLMRGIDVKSAYQLRHMNEIMAGTVQYAVQQTRQKTVQDVAARGLRPTENGVRQQASAATRPKSAYELSREEMADIERRINAGEKIPIF